MNNSKKIMKYLRKFLSLLLITALLMPNIIAFADAIPAQESIYTMDNGYLRVSVNSKNGGFHIATIEGDKLNKDDNNKNLLYPSGDYDTSFTTLRITKNGKAKDYIFGGKYNLLGNPVELSQDETGITATWSVEDFKVIQRMELETPAALNHGMVRITYSVENTGDKDAQAELRILMDTALDKQDYAYYEVFNKGEAGITKVEKESTLEGDDYGNAFFAYNDIFEPTITAYTLKVGTGEVKDPDKVTFGHWNNLAASAFAYKADPSMTFTNPHNTKYLTADSAYALYYNLGTLAKNSAVKAGTIYGVYSNAKIDPDEAKISVNVTADTEKLELNSGKDKYTKENFNITAILNNFAAGNEGNIKHIAMAVRTPNGIYPVVNGNAEKNYSYSDPYTIKYENFNAGQTRTAALNFKAEVRSQSQYRKIILDIYDISGNESGGKLLSQNLIGSAEYYIYCPGGQYDMPKVSIVSGSPKILYNEGKRYFYIAGSGFETLSTGLDAGNYSIILSRTDGVESYKIEKENLKFDIADERNNTAALLLDKPLAPGQYQLIFKAADGKGAEDIKSPAMQVLITDDESKKSITYGLVAVTKTGDGKDSEYTIKVLENEADYKKKYGNNPSDVLLAFRGEFTAEEDSSGEINLVKGSSNSKTDNIMTLNNSIDIQEGIVTIQKDAGIVKVDFNAKLYTTGARTLIWKGNSCLTGIKDGEDYALIPYDENGERGDMDDAKPITLIWGSMAGRGLQAIAGMLLNMEFGNLGVMLDGTKEIRRVVSFGAQLDLGFLFPDPSQLEGGDGDDGSGIKDYMGLLADLATKIPDIADAPTDTLRELFESTVNTIAYGGGEDDGGVTLALRVPDVLFGGAFLGFICSAEVRLPSYIEGFPELEGRLDIKTIGDWSMAAEGKITFTSMTLEGKLGIKSRNGIPVPDNFYIFVGGFSPGLNVDGFGVLWLMGGGGGIENLYDTLFSPGTLPPLTLLLSVQASIMQVVEARADIGLSLRGIDLKLSNGKVLQVKVIDSMRLKLDWYPEFYFLASVNLEILDAIKGAGYIVVEQDGFFEFAAKAEVSIPDDVPVFGGIDIAEVNLGANAQRLYGTAQVLCANLGITYYWGKEFSFGKTDDLDGAGPTYPDLLALEGRPVYLDPETGETLYMFVGTNLSLAAAQVMEGDKALLMDGVGHSLASDIDLINHKLTLSTYDSDHMLVISYDADSLADAKVKYEAMTFGDMDLKLYPAANANANTHINYNEGSGKATIVISFTGDSNSAGDYKKTYEIDTKVPAELMLMKVAELPQLTGVSYDNATKKATVTGKYLDKLDSISFLAVNASNEEDVYLVGKLTGTELSSLGENATTLDHTISLPDTLPSRAYKVQVTANLEGYVADSKTTTGTFTHTNINQPAGPSIGTIANIGDGMVKVNLTDEPYCDGYIVNVYKDNEPTDIHGLTYGKDDEIILYGGKYMVPVFKTETDENGIERIKLVDGLPIVTGEIEKGLDYGVVYTLGISAYKVVSEKIYTSKEESKEFSFTKPEPATIGITSNITPIIKNISYAGDFYNMPYFKEPDITFTLTANKNITGTWTLDGRNGDSLNGVREAQLSFAELSEGEHRIEFIGKDDSKNGLRFSYVFTVDTLAPRLLIESPQNGGFFNDSKPELKGITDKDTRIIVERVVGKTKTVIFNDEPSLNGDGRFTIELTQLPKNQASHDLTITARDFLGNETVIERTMNNEALGSIDSWRLFAGEVDISDKNIMESIGNRDINNAPLTLRAKVKAKAGLMAMSALSGDITVDDPSLISFHVTAISGTATIDDGNRLSVRKGSTGVVSGSMIISDNYAVSASAYFDKVKEVPLPDERPDKDKEKERSRRGDTDIGKSGQLPVSLPIPLYTLRDISKVEAKAGEIIKYTLPAGVNPNLVLVIYISPLGDEMLFPLTMVIDGVLNLKSMEGGTYHIVESTVSFKDTNGHWGNEDILYAAARGLFQGTGDGLFSPDIKLSRAMVVTVLGRLAGAVLSGESSSFSDVPDGSWYTDYVNWAKEKGIVNGVSEISFEPNRQISRQELCTILYRYLNYIGVGQEEEKLTFSDSGDIADWAREAMGVCVGAGLIQGFNNKVRPKDQTSRAESATVFARLIRLLTKISME